MKKFIVCTGGTHVGKTSVLEFLEKEGFYRNISVAGKNMDMLYHFLGKEKYKNWRTTNFLDFQKMNIFKDLELYFDNLKVENSKNNIIFFDRGIFDWIASLKRENIVVSKEIEELINNIKYYSKVFIFDPIGFHNQREQTGRLLNEEISIKWAKYIEEEYKNRGYEIVKVPNIIGKNPDDSIEKRAKFLLENI